MPHDPYKALYLHIPFCVSRCGYCDFHTRALSADADEVASYVDSLVLDIRRACRRGDLAEIESVYIGGGTPTHIGTKHLSALMYALSLSMHLDHDVECSVEGNPESVDGRLIKDIWALGANRFSLGVQSFDDGELQALGRAHGADDAKRALETIQGRFENVSIDLMAGIPAQTPESFVRSLSYAMASGVPHISVYPLILEEGTPFRRDHDRGLLDVPDDDTAADMMETAGEMLEAAGYVRYEVASYAKPGFECRHNIAYWTGKPYLGLGEAATGMTCTDGRRIRETDGRIEEVLSRREALVEDVMMGMRMTQGVSDALVEACAAETPKLPQTLDELQDLGLIRHGQGRWRPTKRGWMLGNELYGRILELA